MINDATGVLWRRLPYLFSPQLDIYKHLSPYVANMDVLEVGFGTGFGTVQLSASAKHVTATEIDKSAVAFAADVFPLLNISWQWGDVTRSIYGKYDAIVCLEVLEHIPDWQVALANIAGALNEGGKLYLSGPNANGSFRKNDKHEREWTATEFRSSLHKYFKNVSLFNYNLVDEQGDDSFMTPLLAVCSHG